MGIFTDIYNTVAKFFRTQDHQVEGDPSKSVAQNRLKLVLMQDRTNLTPRVLEQMRGEMIDLLSKYLEMDKDLLELNFEQEGDQVALMLSIPVIRAKDEDEIEEALKAKAENNDNDTDSEEIDGEKIEENEESSCESSQDNDSEEAPKPKRRRTKKVTPPEELNSEHEGEHENQNSECNESEAVCENVEG